MQWDAKKEMGSTNLHTVSDLLSNIFLLFTFFLFHLDSLCCLLFLSAYFFRLLSHLFLPLYLFLSFCLLPFPFHSPSFLLLLLSPSHFSVPFLNTFHCFRSSKLCAFSLPFTLTSFLHSFLWFALYISLELLCNLFHCFASEHYTVCANSDPSKAVRMES